MTLAQWSKETGIKPKQTDNGSTFVVALNEQFPKLWQLEDFAVSSVCGPVVWLIPKYIH